MIHRFLKRPGIDSLVISPSSLPCRPDDRVKTEHRDAQLARLLRAGKLTAVWLPGARDNRLSGAGTLAGQAGTFLGEEHVEKRPAAARPPISRKDPMGPTAPAFSDRRFAFAHRQFLHEEDRTASVNRRSAVCDWADSWGNGLRLAAVASRHPASRPVADQAHCGRHVRRGDLYRLDSHKQLMAWLGLVPAGHRAVYDQARRAYPDRQFRRASCRSKPRGDTAIPHGSDERCGNAMPDCPSISRPLPGRHRPACTRRSTVRPADVAFPMKPV